MVVITAHFFAGGMRSKITHQKACFGNHHVHYLLQHIRLQLLRCLVERFLLRGQDGPAANVVDVVPAEKLERIVVCRIEDGIHVVVVPVGYISKPSQICCVTQKQSMAGFDLQHITAVVVAQHALATRSIDPVVAPVDNVAAASLQINAIHVDEGS